MNDRQRGNFELDQLLYPARIHRTSVVDRYVVGQHDNVFHVDFRHEPDPPPRPFPGAGSLRFVTAAHEVGDGNESYRQIGAGGQL